MSLTAGKYIPDKIILKAKTTLSQSRICGIVNLLYQSVLTIIIIRLGQPWIRTEHLDADTCFQTSSQIRIAIFRIHIRIDIAWNILSLNKRMYSRVVVIIIKQILYRFAIGWNIVFQNAGGCLETFERLVTRNLTNFNNPVEIIIQSIIPFITDSSVAILGKNNPILLVINIIIGGCSGSLYCYWVSQFIVTVIITKFVYLLLRYMSMIDHGRHHIG